MNFIARIKNISHHTDSDHNLDAMAMLEEELSCALSLYWSTAADIFTESGIALLDPPEEFFLLKNNIFSALFLYSYHRADICKSRRIFYAALNQCYRGMVTGCDNILDDEYKKTLETDLPEHAVHFRSVLDIMASDRIFFDICLRKIINKELTCQQALHANTTSFRALLKSGVQEASEEEGISVVLKPDQVLHTVHHFKTGLLFQSPWAVPMAIENIQKKDVGFLLDALYQIGMGCQLMDDMMDLAMDIEKKRHNYVVSVICHQSTLDEQKQFESLAGSGKDVQGNKELILAFPFAKAVVAKAARELLVKGLEALFDQHHQFLVEPAMSFLSHRIGVGRIMSDIQ